jgi:hypothetical protein
MESEGKVILEDSKRSPRTTVSMAIVGIPKGVHKKLIDYKNKINHERKKQYNLVEAYREFLIENTK